VPSLAGTSAMLLALIPVIGFPVFQRHDEVLATGYLFRGALEMIGYAATAFIWLAMARDTSVPAGPGGSGALNALARLPDVAINPYVDIVFGLGALMLSWLLLRARLVPGWLAIWGLAGAALYLAQGIAAAFGSGWGPLVALLALQEITLAVWLIVKGFAEKPIVSDAGRQREPQLSR
jgi:hypothetical protein